MSNHSGEEDGISLASQSGISILIGKEIESMRKMMRFLKDEEGATAVEYGIMVAAIAAVIVIVVYAIGVKVDTAFDTVNAAM
ncbi:MAG: Flp family type IVb pilin [Nitrospiraceae bacterium]|nr:MAG: Flp family type IVb pilin [Nitrospiraceae bacterium]